MLDLGGINGKFYLMRHGKVYWEEMDRLLNDVPYNDVALFNPHLSDKGRRDVVAMGWELMTRGITPTEICTSTLARARESAHLLQAVLGQDIPVREVHELHESMALGMHNPGAVVSVGTDEWRVRDKEARTGLLTFGTIQEYARRNGISLDIYTAAPYLGYYIEPKEVVAGRMVRGLGLASDGAVIVSHGDALALLIRVLESPEEPIPLIDELFNNQEGKWGIPTYLHRGELWAVQIEGGVVLNRELISVRERGMDVEREVSGGNPERE